MSCQLRVLELRVLVFKYIVNILVWLVFQDVRADNNTAYIWNMTIDDHVTDLTRVALLMFKFNYSNIGDAVMRNVADSLADSEFTEKKLQYLTDMVRL